MGLRNSFLTAIGVASPGSCVNSSVQQNQGVDPLLQTPQAIVPYSVAKFIAQKFHSAACLNSSCTPNSSGVAPRPQVTADTRGRRFPDAIFSSFVHAVICSLSVHPEIA